MLSNLKNNVPIYKSELLVYAASYTVISFKPSLSVTIKSIIMVFIVIIQYIDVLLLYWRISGVDDSLRRFFPSGRS